MCQARVSNKSVLQECFRVLRESVLPECATRVSGKSVSQECPIKVSHKSAPQEYATRVSQKSVPHDCPRRVSSKSVLQVAFNAIAHLPLFIVRNPRFRPMCCRLSSAKLRAAM